MGMIRRRTLLLGSLGPVLLSMLRGPVGAEPRNTFDGRAMGPDELVSLLLDSPRDALLERLVVRIRAGLTYADLLGATAEATARAVSPYPFVGFKYHAFMVLHAVDLTARERTGTERWIPLLWAADTLKAAQADERRRGDWQLGPVAKTEMPSPERAEQAFVEAMETWDAEAADTAVVGFLRAAPSQRIFDRLFQFGARDFRSIGHKAITVANCHRLLETLGWSRAEPLLRSLTYALQNHHNELNPAAHDLPADHHWRAHLSTADALPADWSEGADDPDAVPRLLAVLREGHPDACVLAAAAELRRGVAPQTVWTAIIASAGEQMLRRSGIIAVHANTTTEALRYGYRHTGDDLTRRRLILQAAAFIALFREQLGDRARGLAIDGLEPARLDGTPDEAVAEVFATLDADRDLAARKALAYLQRPGSLPHFIARCRHYTVERNLGYHDYKLTEAAIINGRDLPALWRTRYLATSLYYMNGPHTRTNAVVERARALLSA